MNGYAIALSAFTPVRYKPSIKEVTCFQRVVVTIETAPDPEWTGSPAEFYPVSRKSPGSGNDHPKP